MLIKIQLLPQKKFIPDLVQAIIIVENHVGNEVLLPSAS